MFLIHCLCGQLSKTKGNSMITLGIVLWVIGLIASISILQTIGIILLVVGVILFALGSMGRAVGGRKHYY